MSFLREIRWPRIVAESIAIVASILLAFAIDEWWQNRLDLAQARVLVEDLYTDFRTSDLELARQLEGSRKIYLASSELLDAIQSAAPEHVIGIRVQHVVDSMMTPSYSPTMSALDLAFSTGEINLLQDRELRNYLALWRQKVADNSEEELHAREIVTHRLIPEISRQVRLGGYVDKGPSWLYGEGEDVNLEEIIQVTATREIEGALSQRTLIAGFVTQQLQDIQQNQSRILGLLERRLGTQ